MTAGTTSLVDDFSPLIAKLRAARHCVAFTGAGVSTFSGIPDFRGSNGLYTAYDPDKIFSADYFREDPAYYYNHTKDLVYAPERWSPSGVHHQIARLERCRVVKFVITQNIDLLHQRAGTSRIAELHGSPATHTCLSCGAQYDYETIVPIVQRGETPCCSCGGVIKPDIVFFGDLLPRNALDAAVREASRADLLLILGSSLVVQPAASIPLYTRENGGEIVIVNKMDTPLDHLAALHYRRLEDVCTALAAVSSS